MRSTPPALDSGVFHNVNLLWQRVPGGSRGARIVWLWHLGTLIVALLFLREGKLPWELKLPGPVTASLFKYGLVTGLWWGAVAHALISAALLATVRLWGRTDAPARPVTVRMPLRWGFWLALGLILAGALWLRLPRMNLSYWGDEGWAARYYSHGNWRPAKGATYQDELRFEKVDWRRTLWDDSTGGNHYLFSVVDRMVQDGWRALRGLPDYAFSESLSRMPPLVAGMASIAVIALFLSWLGRGRAGLLAALFFALHPWHIRYSTEARGYTLMVLFATLTLWALLYAQRDGRWRGWLLAGLASFLTAYSWKMAILPLLAVHAVFLLALLRAKSGAHATRWLVAHLTVGALFVFLAGPCLAQAPLVTKELRNNSKPMDAAWLNSALSGPAFGMEWNRDDPLNPHETPMREMLATRPLLTGFVLAAEVLLLIGGVWMVGTQRPVLALMLIGVLLSAVSGALIFKFGVQVEWIPWYSFFVLLPLAFFKGIALDGCMVWMQRRTRAPALAAGLLVVPAAGWAAAAPQIHLLHRMPYENMRAAFELTRGRHEPWNYAGPSKVYTCYLWRHHSLYDPRGDTHVRTGDELKTLMAEVDRVQGELYYIVGQRDLFMAMNPEVMAILQDPQKFEKQATLWAEHSVLTLEIYHYQR